MESNIFLLIIFLGGILVFISLCAMAIGGVCILMEKFAFNRGRSRFSYRDEYDIFVDNMFSKASMWIVLLLLGAIIIAVDCIMMFN